EVARRSHRLVVMSETARRILTTRYKLPAPLVRVIPHGIPDVPFADPEEHKADIDAEGRTVLLTFGLLGRSKGIEMMLEALPDVVQAHPDVLYILLGATHPEVKRHEGERYREELQEQARHLGIEEHLRFVDEYADHDTLQRYFRACDLYVTPYPGREQITSGTLAYAVGMGRAVVSTPYFHAEDLLADERGRLTPFGDASALAENLNSLIEDEDERQAMQERAYAYGRQMTWASVGASYREVFREVVAEQHRAGRQTHLAASQAKLPAPSLHYLDVLTDPTGLFQHTAHGVPDRHHGYCTDDVGRGLVVTLGYYQRHASRHRTPAPAPALRLARTYLSFLYHAQLPSGAFHNFMSFDRRFLDEQGSDDTAGRALWGLGAALAWHPDPTDRRLARQMLQRALDVEIGHPQGLAYALCGLRLALTRYPGLVDVRQRLETCADALVISYERTRNATWRWFHDSLTYGNAKLPEALLHAFAVTGNTTYRDVALETLDFLLDHTYHDGFFDFVGNQGWHRRDGDGAQFGQQSIEAGYTAEACMAAYAATGEARYRELAEAAVAWYLGRNVLGLPLYNTRTSACADGIEAYGVSLNQGAESAIVCQLGLLALAASEETEQEGDGAAPKKEPRWKVAPAKLAPGSLPHASQPDR
ncbi:MAG: glycosyltransferase, partial [Rhodothermales bacterium]